ncbi:CheY-like receiver and HTH DNA-binding domain-containing response regulator [Desulfocapsa sulfexigens DSM 10523]|uniref:CheY-like receiver and HTH DNA-binding domain-containing response regulator n=1 Tax=Desulfocapsa sulfexigens (strain DSM 10523 / SB164P1) TaxID=1167006 RepID=M1PC13_DESSD|nr:response regulator transcription factor [Desulfocapsa sulfexigens]AGF79172.1 CheY-like receiver and HTH DNA-binding domain-containing response regulator [Desulfocapsa sulfexigens DSM 10523]
MKKITVVIIDDHPVIRHGVRSVVKKQPDMIVLGESDSATSALPLVKETQPDVAILDITMAGISGIDLIPYVKALSEKTIIIIYTMHQNHDNIFRACKAGAKGYVLKSDEIRDLLTAIREVMQGEISLSSSFPDNIREQLLKGECEHGVLSVLSPREHEIANLFSQGMTPDEIGEILFISPKTVRVHRTNIMHKLNCSRSNELLLLLQDYFPH